MSSLRIILERTRIMVMDLRNKHARADSAQQQQYNDRERVPSATHQAPATSPKTHLCLYLRSVKHIRVRFQIIGNALIENTGKYQSCMVSKLPIIRKQTVQRLAVRTNSESYGTPQQIPVLWSFLERAPRKYQ